MHSIKGAGVLAGNNQHTLSVACHSSGLVLEHDKTLDSVTGSNKVILASRAMAADMSKYFDF